MWLNGSLPFYKLVVPTVDTVRYSYLVSCLVSSNFPVMLVGPVGTGKTSVAQGVLSKLDPLTYSVLTVNLSAQVRTSTQTSVTAQNHMPRLQGNSGDQDMSSIRGVCSDCRLPSSRRHSKIFSQILLVYIFT